MIFLPLISLFILFVVFGIFIYFHPIRVRNFEFRKLNKIPQNILFIFPHPDDETMFAGSIIKSFSRHKNTNVHVISLTKGEYGNELLKISPRKMSQVREAEFRSTMQILGATKYEIWDFTDGSLHNQERIYSKKIEEYVLEHNISVVFTYEHGGVYAHPDHMSLSKVVGELSSLLGFKSFYATLPKRILKLINLPNKIEVDGKMVLLDSVEHSIPQYRFLSIGGLVYKYKAIKNYKSQKLNHSGIPILLYLILFPFEYFSEE